MAIETEAALVRYLVDTLQQESNFARRVARAVTFDGPRFRGGGVDFVRLFDNLSGLQFRMLLRELGNPRILFDHYPGGPNGECIPRDNCCCADYSRQRQRG